MSLYALWTVAGTFVLIWLLGVTGAIVAGPWVHLLLVAAVGLVASTVFTRPQTI
jgi:hypothetical protein